MHFASFWCPKSAGAGDLQKVFVPLQSFSGDVLPDYLVLTKLCLQDLFKKKL